MKKKLCFEKRILEDQNFLMRYNFGNIIALKRNFWKIRFFFLMEIRKSILRQDFGNIITLKKIKKNKKREFLKT